MQNEVVAFLAGMAVMYLWKAIRWRKVRKWLHQRWEAVLASYRHQARRRRKHS